MKRRRTLIVGAGMSGLTAAAYLLRDGHEVTLLERSTTHGGLVHTYNREGFVFDTGPRAIGNAGILRPMLADLGLDVPLVPGLVSIGVEGEMIHLEKPADVGAYLTALGRTYPGAEAEIRFLDRRIRRFTRMTRWLNAVPNPLFHRLLTDPVFLFRKFLPRMPGFLASLAMDRLYGEPMEAALSGVRATQPSLHDIFSQHYFKGTPAPFAFGYFENFIDYLYPVGGTGRLPDALAGYIRDNGGRLFTGTEAVKVDAGRRQVTDQQGRAWDYDGLLWAGDRRRLFERLSTEHMRPRARAKALREEGRLRGFIPGESVFTLFLAVDTDPGFFRDRHRGHLFYTPDKRGLGEIHRGDLDRIKADFANVSREEILSWLADFCRFNSYEISIPVLKDPTLAPPGKTALIVSFLMDGQICHRVREAGWFDPFRKACADHMISALDGSIYPGLREKILFMDIATPLTLENRFLTTRGAITGWSMEQRPPVPHHLDGIFGTAATGLSRIAQAGQWSYSPAGVPVAILTGRVAAGAMGRWG